MGGGTHGESMAQQLECLLLCSRAYQVAHFL